ncbi:hypothetical protein TNCT_343791 [Trichonephila clavata]|uniref:Uncharacterized protein n=1 Tax=Trichonephila clavata TaxID=2740835 RepID=A0A8X6L6X0_TRICU|nr:hypothetical protein TNCT_343791 [Trichonephila clavata]
MVPELWVYPPLLLAITKRLSQGVGVVMETRNAPSSPTHLSLFSHLPLSLNVQLPCLAEIARFGDYYMCNCYAVNQ